MTVELAFSQSCALATVQVHLSKLNSKGKHFAMSFSCKARAYEPFFAAVLSTVRVILNQVTVDETEITTEIDEAEKILQYRPDTMLAKYFEGPSPGLST